MSQLLPLAKRDNIVIQKTGEDVLIYDLGDNKAFCLNETSALIWQMCDGTKTVSEIGDAVSSELRFEVKDEFVWLALDQLKKEDLISNNYESIFAGMSRREAIRKVGFASMIALPIVVSLVAPSAISAASICGCVNPGDCLSQTTCPSTLNCNPSKQCAP